MSSYFLISAFVEIDFNISEGDSRVLDAILNSKVVAPNLVLDLPDHSFFHSREVIAPLREMCNGLYWAAGCASTYKAPDKTNGARGVATVFLPNVRDPLQWEVYEFLDWLSLFSASDGFIGASIDAQNHKALKAFYIRDQRMYFGNTERIDMTAFSSVEKFTLGGDDRSSSGD